MVTRAASQRNPVQQALEQGQAIWSDYIRRGTLRSGEFQELIEQGVSGVTSNPTIFERAIVGSTDYDSALGEMARTGRKSTDIYEALAVDDIRSAADLLRPIYDRTDGLHGYASLEVSPRLAHDTEGTVAEGERLFDALGSPNVFIKVPATPRGIPAIRRLIAGGINVNVTLLFSLEVYAHVREAYVAGLEDLLQSGGDARRVASVASFFLSRIDTAVDARLDERARHGEADLAELAGRAAVASARLAYRDFQETFSGERFARLSERGARVQRPLWASTGTKNPLYSDVKYVESLIGADTVNTLPPSTVAAFLDHGRVERTVEQGVAEAGETLAALEAAGIRMSEVVTQLLDEGVRSFSDSFDRLLAGIAEKASRLLAQKHVHSGASIGDYLPEVEAALEDLERRRVVPRIWQGDHTVWKDDPKEISNRLGWLTVTDMITDQVPALEAFAWESRAAGFRHVLLAGMGGSSLGPEVLRQTFGSAGGYPQLVVLEAGACIVPAQARRVDDVIEPLDTLFLISSKSGGTIEPLSLFEYFNDIVASAAGRDRAGQNFIAITDPGSPLVETAARCGFERVFQNPPDIGGRYSVLSYFGMVPAALMGIDIGELLERADRMREACAACVPVHENPGAWLGAAIATLAQRGRDKLTLVTSPGISSFGLWVEQLLAESTGKEGKGIIPVVGEPLLEAGSYGDDRVFAYLRLRGEDNADLDIAVDKIRAAGHPVLTLEMSDRFDLGAEFFRWEFATAVAGAILGINPFDQPNVQQAKDATQQVIQGFADTGELPPAETTGTLGDLLALARPGDYLAVMAYLCETPELDDALADLRRDVAERHRIATTLGYGPRFLHSTGQLHKGGPDSGLFLQLSAPHVLDLPVPGKPYGLATVADAQVLGDLRALQSLGRRVVRIHLDQAEGPDIADRIRGLLP